MRNLRITITIAILAAWAGKGNAQCFADYNTYNNFCDLSTLYLEAVPIGGVPPYEFLWETGETTQTIIIPLATADYSVTITDSEGCTVTINCHIKPSPLVLYYPYNQNACEGDTILLFLEWYRDSIPGATYLWSTGDTTPTILVTDDLEWSVTVTDPATGCEFVIPTGLFDFHPSPKPEIIGPTTICDGQTITLSVEGGPFGQIIWYLEGDFNGIYSPTLEVTEPGTWIVWASSNEVNYCWKQDTIIITEGVIIPPILDGPPELCSGQAGSIEITNSSEYTEFLWSDGSSTPVIEVNGPGTYMVTVTDEGGCTSTGSYTIGDGSDFTIDSQLTGTTCGESNGSIDITVTPPGTYTFNWSDGSSAEDLDNIAAGSYTVTVTSSSGCSLMVTALVPDNPVVINLSGIIIPNTSCIDPDGAIDITVEPADNYSFQWSNGPATEDLQNLAPGVYSVTVSLGQTCNTVGTFQVTSEFNAPIVSANFTDEVCGMGDGSIQLIVSGGVEPYTFIWSNGSTSQDIYDLVAGVYQVTVTGANGCTEVYSVDLVNQEIDLILTAEIDSVTLCNGSNGSIDLSVNPPGSYEYLWSNGMTTEDISNLEEGVYSVEVLSGQTCSAQAVFVVEHSGTQPEILADVSDNHSCNNYTGAIDLSISPVGNYTFSWSNGENTEDLSALPPGIYTVTITDDLGCSYFESFQVIDATEVPQFAIEIIPSSCNLPNGAIDLTVTNGSVAGVLWSTGATSEDVSGLEAGLYSVTVTSDEGCTAVTSVEVESIPSEMTLDAVTEPNTSCTQPAGSIDLIVSPPGAYVYYWSNGSTAEDLTQISGGSYSVTVTDSNGCQAMSTFTIPDSTPAISISPVITHASCGQPDGAITIVISPPGDYAVNWSNGSQNDTLPGLVPGNYSVEVTNPDGCTASDSFTITGSNANISIDAMIIPDSTCNDPGGAIQVEVIPAGNYQYTWSNGENIASIDQLNAGTYFLTITDSSMCSIIDTFVVPDHTAQPVITGSVQPESCGLANGTITITITPSSNYTYAWSHGSNEQNVTGLASGSYELTVTSGQGCSATAQFVIEAIGAPLSLEGIISPKTSCSSANGSITLNVLPEDSYTYLWSNGQTSQSIQGLVGGSYSITVTDTAGCSASETFEVPDQSGGPVITGIVLPETCGQQNGAIDITISSGFGIEFQWSNGMVTEDLAGLSAGNYTVTATATNGCSASATFLIQSEGAQFTVSASSGPDTSCQAASGWIDVDIQPDGAYTFEWSNGSTDEDLENLISGIYTVTVTSSEQCAVTNSIDIQDDKTYPEVLSSILPSTCGEDNGLIALEVTEPADKTILWSNGSTSSVIAGLGSGLYSVTVTGSGDCTWTNEFDLPGSFAPEIHLVADLAVTYGQVVTVELELNVSEEVLDTIIWYCNSVLSCQSGMCYTQEVIVFEPTEVSVTVVDTNGCITERSINLDISEDATVYIPNVFSPNGDGANDFFTVMGSTGIEEIVDLRIYDRWGEFVFQNTHFPPNAFEYGWDGSFRGKLLQPAVFVYWTIVRFTDGTERLLKGDVTLLR